MPANWKTVRVFISSTFRDMQSERDHLVRFVFPRLREQLIPHRIHLVDVDLRWGVTSEQDALEVCRDVINECRPRFLCILGGRYGWVPPGKTRSVTDDEVRYAVLDRAARDRGFAYFYFRDDAATSAMVETGHAELREPEGSDQQRKLAQLKQAIVTAGLSPFMYTARWDSESKRFTDLKTLGDRVYNDLLASMKSDPALRNRFSSEAPALTDEFGEENAAMEAFIEERSESFVLGSRAPVLEELLAHANATDGNSYLCLTGAAGSGKSALLAFLSRRVTSAARSSMALICHFAGASPGSTDVRRMLRRLCHELKDSCSDITTDIPGDSVRLASVFPVLLREVCARRPVLIVLDALNQIDPASQSGPLHWLPEELPANARVILSTLEGPALNDLRTRHKAREIELKALTTSDCEAIIEQFRERYRKNFEPSQRAALLAKKDARAPLYLLVALEELRTLGTFEEITRRIVELPPTIPELFAQIMQRLQHDDGFRDAVGRRVGDRLVPRFAALLSASRHGMSQRELTDLLDPNDPEGNVAALLYLLRPYLMRRGELLDFYHAQFRKVVEEQYDDREMERLTAHEALADYFYRRADPTHDRTWAGTDPRALSELQFHQTQGHMWSESKELICDARYRVACMRSHGPAEYTEQLKFFADQASKCPDSLPYLQELARQIPINDFTRPILFRIGESLGHHPGAAIAALTASAAENPDDPHALIPLVALRDALRRNSYQLTPDEQPPVTEAVCRLLRSKNKDVRWEATHDYDSLVGGANVGPLLTIVETDTEHPLIRAEAARILGIIGSPAIVSNLRRISTCDHYPLKVLSARSARRIELRHEMIATVPLDDWSQPQSTPRSDLRLPCLPKEIVVRKADHGNTNAPIVFHIIENNRICMETRWKEVEVIECLLRSYPCHLICVEGGVGDCSLTALRNTKSQEIWETVATRFFHGFRLSPEEYLNLVTQFDFQILGVDDASSHRPLVERKRRGDDARDIVADRLRAEQLWSKSLRRIDETHSEATILITQELPGQQIRALGNNAAANGAMTYVSLELPRLFDGDLFKIDANHLHLL